jgi:hypothetical protein
LYLESPKEIPQKRKEKENIIHSIILRHALVSPHSVLHKTTPSPITARPSARRVALNSSVDGISIRSTQHALLVASAIPEELIAIAEEIALLGALAVGGLRSGVEEAAAGRVLEFAAAARVCAAADCRFGEGEGCWDGVGDGRAGC